MFYLLSNAQRPTVCVSGGGAGVDKTPRPRFCSGVEKARKCRRIPTVHCTLCWARWTWRLFGYKRPARKRDYILQRTLLFTKTQTRQ